MSIILSLYKSYNFLAAVGVSPYSNNLRIDSSDMLSSSKASFILIAVILPMPFISLTTLLGSVLNILIESFPYC